MLELGSVREMLPHAHGNTAEIHHRDGLGIIFQDCIEMNTVKMSSSIKISNLFVPILFYLLRGKSDNLTKKNEYVANIIPDEKVQIV